MLNRLPIDRTDVKISAHPPRLVYQVIFDCFCSFSRVVPAVQLWSICRLLAGSLAISTFAFLGISSQEDLSKGASHVIPARASPLRRRISVSEYRAQDSEIHGDPDRGHRRLATYKCWIPSFVACRPRTARTLSATLPLDSIGSG